MCSRLFFCCSFPYVSTYILINTKLFNQISLRIKLNGHGKLLFLCTVLNNQTLSILIYCSDYGNYN